MNRKLIFFGVGQVALAVARFASDRYLLYGTTRDSTRAPFLGEREIRPIVISPWSQACSEELSELCSGAYVLASFPPDQEMDKQMSSLCATAASLIYISSTGVYGKISGQITEMTDVDYSEISAARRLHAEETWREAGAIILRAPGLYGPESGLHKRLVSGAYKMPGKGERFSSRIHLKDLSRIILAAFAKPLPRGSLYLVGDLKPTTQREVISWLCTKLRLPLPESVPLESVSETLRGNRQIVATQILKELAIDLEFPTYEEGYYQCLAEALPTSTG
jgi:nucleoside-diphosphate-sugar epimerase